MFYYFIASLNILLFLLFIFGRSVYYYYCWQPHIYIEYTLASPFSIPVRRVCTSKTNDISDGRREFLAFNEKIAFLLAQKVLLCRFVWLAVGVSVRPNLLDIISICIGLQITKFSECSTFLCKSISHKNKKLFENSRQKNGRINCAYFVVVVFFFNEINLETVFIAS